MCPKTVCPGPAAWPRFQTCCTGSDLLWAGCNEQEPTTVIPRNALIEANQSGLIAESLIDITPQQPIPDWKVSTRAVRKAYSLPPGTCSCAAACFCSSSALCGQRQMRATGWAGAGTRPVRRTCGCAPLCFAVLPRCAECCTLGGWHRQTRWTRTARRRGRWCATRAASRASPASPWCVQGCTPHPK